MMRVGERARSSRRGLGYVECDAAGHEAADGGQDDRREAEAARVREDRRVHLEGLGHGKAEPRGPRALLAACAPQESS